MDDSEVESPASILASVKEQEAQFEKLTRALEEERRHVSAQLERVRVSPQDASPLLANGTLTRRHQVTLRPPGLPANAGPSGRLLPAGDGRPVPVPRDGLRRALGPGSDRGRCCLPRCLDFSRSIHLTSCPLQWGFWVGMPVW